MSGGHVFRGAFGVRHDPLRRCPVAAFVVGAVSVQSLFQDFVKTRLGSRNISVYRTIVCLTILAVSAAAHAFAADDDARQGWRQLFSEPSGHEYAANIASGPVVVTNQGQPMAVLVAIDGADLESISLGTNPEFIDLIERSRVRAEGAISSAEMRRRFE